ncbi:MAG TPA: hypothetical protein VGA78_07860 [Gemmatimonadales bacterium]
MIHVDEFARWLLAAADEDTPLTSDHFDHDAAILEYQRYGFDLLRGCYQTAALGNEYVLQLIM